MLHFAELCISLHVRLNEVFGLLNVIFFFKDHSQSERHVLGSSILLSLYFPRVCYKP